MKRISLLLTSIVMALCLCFGLAACNAGVKGDNLYITLDTTAVTKVFDIGDEFNCDGLIVTAHYGDESKVVEDYSVKTPDMTTAGAKDVVVNYNGAKSQYTVTVRKDVTAGNEVVELGAPVVKYVYDSNAVAVDGATTLVGGALEFTAKAANGYKVAKVTALVGGVEYAVEGNGEYTIPAEVLTDNAVVTVAAETEGKYTVNYYGENGTLLASYGYDSLDEELYTPDAETYYDFNGWYVDGVKVESLNAELFADGNSVAVIADWSLNGLVKDVPLHVEVDTINGDNKIVATISISDSTVWTALIGELEEHEGEILGLGVIQAIVTGVKVDGLSDEAYKAIKGNDSVADLYAQEKSDLSSARYGAWLNTEETAYLHAYHWGNVYGSLQVEFKVTEEEYSTRYFNPWVIISAGDDTVFIQSSLDVDVEAQDVVQQYETYISSSSSYIITRKYLDQSADPYYPELPAVTSSAGTASVNYNDGTYVITVSGISAAENNFTYQIGDEEQVSVSFKYGAGDFWFEGNGKKTDRAYNSNGNIVKSGDKVYFDIYKPDDVSIEKDSDGSYNFGDKTVTILGMPLISRVPSTEVKTLDALKFYLAQHKVFVADEEEIVIVGYYLDWEQSDDGITVPVYGRINSAAVSEPMDLLVSKDELKAPNTAQLKFDANATYLLLLRGDKNGSVFSEYGAAYVEIEITKGETTYYAYLFNVNGKTNLCSDVDMSNARECGSIGDSYIGRGDFNTWASKVFEADFRATDWTFRTKIHVDENSVWKADGDWSDPIKFTPSSDTAPNSIQMKFENANTLQFVREGGAGTIFTIYNVAYVEVKITKGDKIYTGYLIADGNDLYVSDGKSLAESTEYKKCTGGVGNAYMSVSTFNEWASKAFNEDGFEATEWTYNTKIHVGENSLWTYDGDWSADITYNA